VKVLDALHPEAQQRIRAKLEGLAGNPRAPGGRPARGRGGALSGPGGRLPDRLRHPGSSAAGAHPPRRASARGVRMTPAARTRWTLVKALDVLVTRLLTWARWAEHWPLGQWSSGIRRPSGLESPVRASPGARVTPRRHCEHQRDRVLDIVCRSSRSEDHVRRRDYEREPCAAFADCDAVEPDFPPRTQGYADRGSHDIRHHIDQRWGAAS
jgi:hypothetical protein